MKITKLTRTLVLATIAAGVFAAGCELIVDFDRTKIPVEASDAALLDGALPDANLLGDGSTAPDTGAADGGADAAADAPADAPEDG